MVLLNIPWDYWRFFFYTLRILNETLIYRNIKSMIQYQSIMKFFAKIVLV